MHYMAGILNTFFAALVSGSSIVLGTQFKTSDLFNFWELPKKNKCN